MNTKLYNQKGENIGEISLPGCLNIKTDDKLVSRYVRYLLEKKREAVANTKDRGQVSGGGKKPWRQKGTGNARAGSTRSPLWRGGGVTFGPGNDQTYEPRMNTKERQKALMMTMVSKIEGVVVVDKIEIKEPKTKKALEVLNKLPVGEGTIMLICSEFSDETYLSFRNLPFVNFTKVGNLNALDILKTDQLVFDKPAVEELAKVYTNVK